MSTSYTKLFTSSDLANAAAGQTVSQSITSPTGCSIRVDNYSPYLLDVFNGTTLIDVIPSNSFVIFPIDTSQSLTVQVNASVNSGVTQPFERVSYKIVTGVQNYQMGSLWQPNGAITNTINTAVPGGVQINNTSIPVTNETGGSLTVAGTLDANITGSNVTIDTSNVDAFIASNSLVLIGTQTINISNLSNGNSVSSAIIGPLGYYDGFYAEVDSSASELYSIINANCLRNNTSNTKALATSAKITQLNTDSQGFQNFLAIPASPLSFNQSFFSLENNSGSTITTDSVTINVYAIMASVTASISGGTAYYFNESISTGSSSFTIAASSVGGSIKQIGVSVWQLATNGSGADIGSVEIQNNGNTIFAITQGGNANPSPSLQNPSMSFSDGIPNDGVTLVLNMNGGNGVTSATGFVVIG